MPKRDRRLKEEIKKCKETNRSLNDFFSTTGVLDIFKVFSIISKLIKQPYSEKNC